MLLMLTENQGSVTVFGYGVLSRLEKKKKSVCMVDEFGSGGRGSNRAAIR